MKAVVLSTLQQMTGDPRYGKQCYNDVYIKKNGESVRRLKFYNWDKINESNFKHFQDTIAALSNDQFRVELDRLNYRNDYRQIIVRIITLVKQPAEAKVQSPVENTATVSINVITPTSLKDQIVAYLSNMFKVGKVVTY